MTERSRPWSGIVTGDAGPYSDDQWSDVWKQFAPTIASQGVLWNQLNIFDLSSVAATPVSVASGRALVNGIWYESDAAVSIAIPTPAVNPRVDRIVARADWALQTVRITRVAGAEAASPVPPALVQVDGTTWDLPLWQVHATTGAVLTFFRDERSFIGQYEPSQPTDEYVYLSNEMFMGSNTITASETFNNWAIEIVGSYQVQALAFGGGAARLTASGAGAGHVAFFSVAHRPDDINAHTIFRAKNPNTDANLDRLLGYTSLLSDVTPTNGYFFRSVGTGNWFAVCRAAGVETVVDTSQALDDVWRKFEMRQHGTDVVTFLIDDVVVATIQTDVPGSVDLNLASLITDSGTNPADVSYMDTDRIRMAGTVVRPS